MTEPIPGKDDITPPEMTPETGQEIPDQAPSGQEFAPLMEGGGETQAAQEGVVSPMDLAGGPQKEVTPDTLVDGLNQLGSKTQQFQSILTPSRYDELTPGQRSLLHSKLTQFKDHVRGLAQQTGTPAEEEEEGAPPPGSAAQALKTYVGWLTSGQATIQNVASSIGEKGSKQMSVAAMLRAQAKMVAAERAISFASAVAGKGTDFIKQIMQTQI